MAEKFDWPFDTPPRSQLTEEKIAQLEFFDRVAEQGCTIHGYNLTRYSHQRPFEEDLPHRASFSIHMPEGRGGSLGYRSDGLWKFYTAERRGPEFYGSFEAAAAVLMAYVLNGTCPPPLWKCRFCGGGLATKLAKQCLHCGANWH